MNAEAVARRYAAVLNWKIIAGPILDVFQANCQADEEKTSVYKASSDNWTLNEELRHQLWQRAREFWYRRTGLDPTWFPLSVDFVSRLYIHIRKMKEQPFEAFVQAIDAAPTVPLNGMAESEEDDR